MNKTIIININGIVFHIEEDAYEILKNYMTDVKRHFLNSADSHEITTDIENRIAEMFSEILVNENKQVIIEQDVKQVVEQMGSVKDFENAEEEGNPTSHHTYSYNKSGERTLFRDPDDYLLGGVCSGLANYFDIQTIWVRLLIVFVAFLGIGVLLYVILWIVIPKAITRADRMAMKGEKLNLQGFKNNFEEELNAVHHQLKNLQKEAKPLIYKLRDFLGEFFLHFGRFVSGVVKILIKLFGIFILLACLAGAVALIIFLGLLTVWSESDHHIFKFAPLTTSPYATKIYISGFVAAIIPLLAIFLLTLKSIFNTRTIDKSIAAVIFVVWLFAIGVLGFYGSKIIAQFRSSASFDKTISITPTPKNIYYLKLNDVKYFSHDDSVRLDIKANFQNMVITDNSNNDEDYHYVSISIEKSDVAKPVLVETFSAKGGNYDDALINARNMRYNFAQQDSVLKFDRYLQRTEGAGWHFQTIKLILKVPMNTTLVIDKSITNYINSWIGINDCNRTNKKSTDLDFAAFRFNENDNNLACVIDTIVTAKPDTTKVIKKAK